MAKAKVTGIKEYQTAKGPRFLAQVRLIGHKPVSKSFESRQEAADWKRAQEVDAQRGVLATDPGAKPLPTMLLADCFAAFRDSVEKGVTPASWDAMKMQYDRIAGAFDGLRVCDITEQRVTDHFKARVKSGVSPATNLSDFIRLRNALRSVARENRATWGEFDPLGDDVRKRLKAGKLIAQSEERISIFSEEQLGQLRGYFADDQQMLDIINLANANAFRRGEIERMEWAGFNEVRGILSLDRKDSSKAKGRRRAPVPLLPEAIEIIARQPRIAGEERIFPTAGDLVSRKFAAALAALGFNVGAAKDEELCFHSLRHTALTRLARNLKKLGLEVLDLMAISGHKSIRHLNRYLHNDRDRAHEIAANLRGFRVMPVQKAA